MTVLSVSKQEFRPLDVLLRVQAGRLRVDAEHLQGHERLQMADCSGGRACETPAPTVRQPRKRDAAETPGDGRGTSGRPWPAIVLGADLLHQAKCIHQDLGVLDPPVLQAIDHHSPNRHLSARCRHA